MNDQYLEAVKTIKTAILKSQNRAAKHTNTEMLSLYYGIGGYVSGNSREGTWGTGAIDEISSRLREEMLGLRGFSSRNLKMMRQFFEAWQPYLQTSVPSLSESNSAAVAAELKMTSDASLLLSEKRQPSAAEFPIDAFTSISFTHHMEILSKTNDMDERLFYIRECAAGHWSKTALRARLKEDLYNHQGTLPNNFSMTLPDDKQYAKAIRMFKDEYFLDFINTEELDLSDPEDLDERVLEKEIIDHIRNFIQCLGSGFCFVGNQHRINELKEGRKAFTQDEWIDVLLRSCGYEPDQLNQREKWLLLARLIPLVENSFNLCELGPRSTGKSHIYKEICPNSILVSGGQTTVANLFYNMGRKTVGLVGLWDCVAFDEVAGIKFKDKDGIQIMKDYMASGSFARGKEEKTASASMVFVGNINQSVDVLLKTSSLFDPFPPEMGTDTAFLDRLHCYIPGWEIPKFRPEHFTDDYGLITGYLAEFIRELRKEQYGDALDKYYRLGKNLNQRDTIAVRKDGRRLH